MNEMVERVARVFAAANLDGCETLEGGGDLKACIGRCLCRETARAVIAAMREPTEEMAEKAMANGDDIFCGVWYAMIDAALAA